MADVKISQLPLVNQGQITIASDSIPIVTSGTTSRASPSSIVSAVFQVLSGSGAPANSLGNPGNFYLQTNVSPYLLWYKNGATWAQAGSSGGGGSGVNIAVNGTIVSPTVNNVVNFQNPVQLFNRVVFTIPSTSNVQAVLDPQNPITTTALTLTNTAGTAGITLDSAGTIANYNLNFPVAQGSANQVMINDGSGNLSWITAGGIPIPYMEFTGSAAGGTGQTFTNSNLSQYTDVNDIDLFVNGARARPTTNFTLSGSTLTYVTSLTANALLQIDSKVVRGNPSATFYILLQTGDVMNTQNSNRLETQLGL